MINILNVQYLSIDQKNSNSDICLFLSSLAVSLKSILRSIQKQYFGKLIFLIIVHAKVCRKMKDNEMRYFILSTRISVMINLDESGCAHVLCKTIWTCKLPTVLKTQ